MEISNTNLLYVNFICHSAKEWIQPTTFSETDFILLFNPLHTPKFGMIYFYNKSNLNELVNSQSSKLQHFFSLILKWKVWILVKIFMSWRGSLRDIFRVGMVLLVQKYTVPETCFKINSASLILVYMCWQRRWESKKPRKIQLASFPSCQLILISIIQSFIQLWLLGIVESIYLFIYLGFHFFLL